MKAGRELDAKVGSEVFGWKVKIIDGYGWMYSLPDRNRWTNVPCFSTQIADAWIVLEKFEGYVIDKNPYSGKYRVTVCSFKDMVGYRAIAETSPLAVCLAALKAVGVTK